ncbi:uncharacterized protein [Amphiura filiformis]|uniref:uncharacterized protein isoform X2 n=1 Tax=Amphiura filiformis TaxID=82378 RepID=UPI003B2222E9
MSGLQSSPSTVIVSQQPQGALNYNVIAGQITGVIQIMCGLVSITTGVIAYLAAGCVMYKHQCVDDQYGYHSESHMTIYGSKITTYYDKPDMVALLASPIWGSVCFYVVAGLLGICTSSKNRCVIVAYMVMSILSSLAAFDQAILESMGAVLSARFCSGFSSSCIPKVQYNTPQTSQVPMTHTVGHPYSYHP